MIIRSGWCHGIGLYLLRLLDGKLQTGAVYVDTEELYHNWFTELTVSCLQQAITWPFMTYFKSTFMDDDDDMMMLMMMATTIKSSTECLINRVYKMSILLLRLNAFTNTDFVLSRILQALPRQPET